MKIMTKMETKYLHNILNKNKYKINSQSNIQNENDNYEKEQG